MGSHLFQLFRFNIQKWCHFFHFKVEPHDVSKEFLDIQATTECGFTLKRVHDMTRTCRQHVTFKKFSRRLQVCWGGSLAEGRGDAKEKIKTNENFFAHKKFFLSVIIAISSCL